LNSVSLEQCKPNFDPFICHFCTIGTPAFGYEMTVENPISRSVRNAHLVNFNRFTPSPSNELHVRL
jgi:hypothetical protein